MSQATIESEIKPDVEVVRSETTPPLSRGRFRNPIRDALLMIAAGTLALSLSCAPDAKATQIINPEPKPAAAAPAETPTSESITVSTPEPTATAESDSATAENQPSPEILPTFENAHLPEYGVYTVGITRIRDNTTLDKSRGVIGLLPASGGEGERIIVYSFAVGPDGNLQRGGDQFLFVPAKLTETTLEASNPDPERKQLKLIIDLTAPENKFIGRMESQSRLYGLTTYEIRGEYNGEGKDNLLNACLKLQRAALVPELVGQPVSQGDLDLMKKTLERSTTEIP